MASRHPLMKHATRWLYSTERKWSLAPIAVPPTPRWSASSAPQPAKPSFSVKIALNPLTISNALSSYSVISEIVNSEMSKLNTTKTLPTQKLNNLLTSFWALDRLSTISRPRYLTLIIQAGCRSYPERNPFGSKCLETRQGLTILTINPTTNQLFNHFTIQLNILTNNSLTNRLSNKSNYLTNHLFNYFTAILNHSLTNHSITNRLFNYFTKNPITLPLNHQLPSTLY